jgi:hypothetical protein
MLLLLLGGFAALLPPAHGAHRQQPCGNGTWVADVDYQGAAPLGVLPAKGLTQAECCAMCVRHPHCAAVTWNGPQGTWKDGGCNLKACSSTHPCHRRSVGGQYSCVVRPPPPADPDEDVSEAWLRYRPVASLSVLQRYKAAIKRAVVTGGAHMLTGTESQAQLRSAAAELQRGLVCMHPPGRRRFVPV